MEFRRSGGRDDRRRRVLIDESQDESSGSGRRTKHVEGSPKGYTEEAQDSHQARITDLIPKRHWVLAVLALSGTMAIGSLALIHSQLSNGATAIANAELVAFDVSAPASVLVWFSSFLLLVGAAVSLQIYALRRYKEDDYRGCYRMWLWSAAIFVIASIDATAKLHGIAQASLVRLTGTTLYGDGRIWALIAGGLLFGGFAIRLLIEIRHCFKSLVVGLKAVTAYATSAALYLGIVTLSDPATTILVQAATLVSGHFLVLLSLWYYARHVHLDAHGQLTSQKSAAKKQAASEQQASRADDDSGSNAGENSSPLLDPQEIDELEQIEDSFDQQPRSRKKLKEKQSRPNADVLSMETKDDYDEENSIRSKSKADHRHERKMKNRQRRAA